MLEKTKEPYVLTARIMDVILTQSPTTSTIVVPDSVKTELIGVIPNLLGHVDGQQRFALTELKTLMDAQKSLTIPVLDAMVDLNLSSDILSEIQMSLIDSLPILPKHVLPGVLRFIFDQGLKADVMSSEVVPRLRLTLQTLENVNPSVATAVLESLKTLFRLHKPFTEAYLKYIKSLAENNPNPSTYPFFVTDIVLCFILLRNNSSSPTLKKRIETIMKKDVLTTHGDNSIQLSELLGKSIRAFNQPLTKLDCFNAILSFSETLLRSCESNEMSTDSSSTTSLVESLLLAMFEVFSDKTSRSQIMDALMTHLGSSRTVEIQTSLRLLQSLTQTYFTDMNRLLNEYILSQGGRHQFLDYYVDGLVSLMTMSADAKKNNRDGSGAVNVVMGFFEVFGEVAVEAIQTTSLSEHQNPVLNNEDSAVEVAQLSSTMATTTLLDQLLVMIQQRLSSQKDVDKKLGVVGTVSLIKVLGRATSTSASTSTSSTTEPQPARNAEDDTEMDTENAEPTIDTLTKMQSSPRLTKILQLFDMIIGYCKKSMSCMLMFYDHLAELLLFDAGKLDTVLVDFVSEHATLHFSEYFLCEPEVIEQIQANITKLVGCDDDDEGGENVNAAEGEEQEGSEPKSKPKKSLLSISEWTNLNGSESTIGLKVLPVAMQALDTATSSSDIASHKQLILLLCSLFRLVVACEKIQNNGCLDGVDALLGCGLIMFEKMDMVVWFLFFIYRKLKIP